MKWSKENVAFKENFSQETNFNVAKPIPNFHWKNVLKKLKGIQMQKMLKSRRITD